jgi:hypothetical protein
MLSKLFVLLFALKLFTANNVTVLNNQLLAAESMSLSNRYPVPSVNTVMKENILLTLAYMSDQDLTPANASQVIGQPQHYKFRLRFGETFAFHDHVLPEYSAKIAATTNSHFNTREGFKSDGYLVGDGVCHLASLFNLAAQKAGLVVNAPTSHDFAKIPDIPKKYGVSIYSSPVNPSGSARQNLYITNPYQQDIQLIIDSDHSRISIRILKLVV